MKKEGFETEKTGRTRQRAMQEVRKEKNSKKIQKTHRDGKIKRQRRTTSSKKKGV